MSILEQKVSFKKLTSRSKFYSVSISGLKYCFVWIMTYHVFVQMSHVFVQMSYVFVQMPFRGGYNSEMIIGHNYEWLLSMR